jgi:uncharacterized LabA/DUF88 family protein
MKKENNIAFIDAQNLHLWTQTENWKIDFKRFRIYLKDKFKINEAYFFLWFVDDEHQTMYRKIQKAGFILEFREHNSNMKWKKKWNVDVDIVYDIMHRLLEEDDFDKIVLVSWDWDYIKLVKYLISKNRFKKILFPNKKYSSLYKPFKDNYWLNLSIPDLKNRLKFKQ